MGGLMEPLLKVATEQVAEKTAAETEKKSKLEDIRSIMKKLNMTAQQAMEILDVPTDKQNEYASLFQANKFLLKRNVIKHGELSNELN